MFQFTTTTIINQNLDVTSNQPLWTAQNEDLAKGTVGSFNVKRHLKFEKPNVVAIYKAEAYDPTYAKATIDLSSIIQESGVYRIAMYIRLSGNQNSYYSNNMVFKGKPLYIEFEKKKGDSHATLAKKVANIAKKYMTMLYEKELVKVSNDNNNVVIDSTDEYQLFTKVALEWFNPNGAYEIVAEAKEATDTAYDGKNTLVQGKQGFGTYPFLLHNLRLPTSANTRWTHTLEDETPILGAKYNQYIIEYCVNRGVMGTDAVGDLVRSKTTHVFYVNQTVSADFENGLNAIGGITNGKSGNTDVEKALNTANEALKKVAILEKQMPDKVDASQVYKKTEIDTKLNAKANDVDVVKTSAMGDGIEYTNSKVTVKLDGNSLQKSSNGLKVTGQ